MISRILASLVALALLCAGAQAQSGGGLSFGGQGRSLSYSIPQPAVDMDFSAGWYQGCSLASCLTVTNSTGGYVTNLDGTLTNIAANTPRIGVGSGLLVEESRTNILLQSQTIDNAAWTKTNAGTGSVAVVTADQGVAPDGTTTADRVQLALNGGTTTSDLSWLRQAVTVSSSTTYAWSIWMKSNTGSTYVVSLPDVTTGALITATVTPEWKRFDIASTTGGAFTAGLPGIRLRGGLTPANSDSADLLVWGGQLEVGAFPTSYIPTTTVAVARSADAIQGIGNLRSSTTGPAKTILAQINGAQNQAGFGRIVSFNNAQNSPITLNNNTSTIISHITAVNLTPSLGSGASTGLVKAAASMDASGRSIVGNNGTLLSDSNNYTNTVLYIGNANSANYLGGYIQRLTLWPVRLPDNVLPALTDPLKTPTVGLDFANNNYTVNGHPVALSSLVTNVNSTGGYCTNADGSLSLIAANLPRVCSGTGLLVEETRTNVTPQSQAFANAAWLKLSSGTGIAPVVTGDFSAAPDGTTTASRVQLNVGGGSTASDISRVVQIITIANTTPHATSYYFKSNTGANYSIVVTDESNNNSVVTVTPTWTRYTIVHTSTSSTGRMQFALVGSVTPGTADILVWGAQLEAGSSPTSYIPTTTVAVARSADNVTAVASGWLTQALQAAANSAYASFVIPSMPTTLIAPRIFDQNAGATGMYISTSPNQSANALWANAAAAVTANFYVPNSSSRAGVAMQSGAQSAVLNGGTVATATSATAITLGTITLGNRGAGDRPLNGTIANFKAWNYKLPDAVLQSATNQ